MHSTCSALVDEGEGMIEDEELMDEGMDIEELDPSHDEDRTLADVDIDLTAMSYLRIRKRH